MEYHADPQLRDEILARLERKYMVDKPMPHLTELIYCLTKGYFERTDPLPWSAKELTLFSIGFGLEEVLLRDKDDKAPVSQQLDKLWLTPDYFALRGGQMDLKSTRMYPGEEGAPKRGWPDGWLIQFKAYTLLEYVDSIGAVDTADIDINTIPTL